MIIIKRLIITETTFPYQNSFLSQKKYIFGFLKRNRWFFLLNFVFHSIITYVVINKHSEMIL
jgi:hypothetical protein